MGWTTILEEDENGDAVFTLPPEFMNEYDWREGDEYEVKAGDNGEVIIDNISKKERDDAVA